MTGKVRGLAAAAVVTLLAALYPASATAAPRITLYGADRRDATKVSLRGWGSGQASEDRSTGYRGFPTSIKLVTHGLFSGGRMVFEPPIDMTEQLTGPDSRSGFLEFVVNMQGAADPNADPLSNTGAPPTPSTRFLRVVLVFDGGTAEVPGHPVVLYATGDGAWSSVAIPFAAFKGLAKIKSLKLKEIRVFGDNRDEFNIGEIRTTTDEEPIDVEPLESREVALNDQVDFQATATAGLSTLKYTWDFDASDGLQEEATGAYVSHVFRQASPMGPNGDLVPLTVTLTVTDMAGVKAPVVRKAEISVNP